MRAECIGKNRDLIWLRIPHRDAHRVLTLPAKLWPQVRSGDEIAVKVTGMEQREPSGWTAMVVPV